MTSGDICEDQSFKELDFPEICKATEYFNCTFKRCNFTESDISHLIFIECTFDECNMKMIKVANTTFKDVMFRKSNLMGVNFFECNKFMLSFSFEKCDLRLASFNSLSLKKIKISDSLLKEVDFTDADISEARLIKCDLENAIFDHTMIKKADLSSSENYSIDPEINTLTGSRFSLYGLPGLLDKYNIVIE